MTYTTSVLDEWPGLDLRRVYEGKGAQDVSDVWLGDPGLLRTRGGYTVFHNSNIWRTLAYYRAVLGSGIIGCDATDTYALNASAATTNSLLGYTFTTSVNHSTPTSGDRIYLGGQGRLFYHNETAGFVVPTVTVDGVPGLQPPKGAVLGRTTLDNRLIVANTVFAGGGPNGVNGSLDHIWFSEPGNPGAWLTNNYVILNPGRAEVVDPNEGPAWGGITATANFGRWTIMFKRNCFATFGNTSTDGTGLPVFNYTLYDNGIGCMNVDSVAVAPDGVYFVGKDGVYRTAGGEPQRISQALDPLWGRGELPASSPLAPFFTDPTILDAITSLTYHEGHLYFYCYPGATPRTFVYSIESGQWTMFSVAMRNAITPSGYTALTAGMYFLAGLSGATSKIYRYDSDNSLTTDNGTAIASHYTGVLSDLGSSEQKTIRQVAVRGTGSPTLAVSTDLVADTGSAVALGASLSEKLDRTARRGTFFSFKLSGTGVWSVHRLVAYLREQRLPGQRVA